jgi:starch phosphorylase
MNEGHSAFLVLERMREMVDKGLTLEEAGKLVKSTNIFTTHTPVPAGNDQFPIWLMDKYFASYWPSLKLNRDEFIDLAKHAQPWGETFSMPILALRLSEQRNAVSELHGHVSRNMWHFLYPDKKVDEVPITHITNGIHTSSWLAREIILLFEKYLGQDFLDNLVDLEMWSKIDSIPDEELWDVRTQLKNNLMNFANERVRTQWASGLIHPVQVIAGGSLLDPKPLTIGFARRYATYKRATLILSDYERLLQIINDPDRPVQIIFAGKAHPADEPGKLLIQQIYRAAKDAKNGGRIAFLEDYDMNVARHLVQGVDVWLNTPRKPNEASGTSGMKAAVNGVMNCSILDGWWHEAYNGRNGWAIGKGQTNENTNQLDAEESKSLYSLLENEIVPLYYGSMNEAGIPVEWVKRIKDSIRTLAPQFSTSRMLQEYMSQLYLPALEKSKELKKTKA